MTTSPVNTEAGECSNIYSGPFSTPNGSREKPKVFPNCLVMPVEMSRSNSKGSFSVSQSQVPSQVRALQTNADGGLVTHPWSASPVGVSGCTEYLQKMIFRFSSDRKSILGSKMLSGGLVSEDTRLVTLKFVPRLIGPSFPKHFLEFRRAGSVGFGASGQEVNSFSSKELLSLSGEVMLVEDVADFSMGFGETELTDCLPLRIIAPSASTTSAKLEEVTEALSIEAKLDIFGWVKHKIPGFSKLVGLSMTRHEKLCIALLQRLETEMEAANVLHQKGTSSQKVAKSKTRDVESYET